MQERGAEFAPKLSSDRLPILGFAAEIKQAILKNPSVIVVGETGSGKTTQLPSMLLDVLPPRSKIAVTQPRRIAATSVARYVANQRRSKLGSEVGYQVRFDDHTTVGTRINFYTDGLLLRKIQADPQLLEFDAVMVDEAHERNLDTDFLLGLLKDVQRKRADIGKGLKLVVTSATIEEEKFSNFFDHAPAIHIPGRQYPVSVHYDGTPNDYAYAAASRARRLMESESTGNILIFMPGVEEIRQTIRQLQFSVGDATILPLHGQLSPEEQDKVFQLTSRRKIIVATNIAETSVTIPDVRFVIDSGLIRQVQFNPNTGIEALVTVAHAQSGGIQRAGRAGRVGAGECYRLYTEEDFNYRSPFQTPEIQRANLGHVVLRMKKLGIENVEEFEFIDPPNQKLLLYAIETLQTLGALDDEGNLTKIGDTMAEFPLEPHASRTIVEAMKNNCVSAVCAIMAFNSLRSVFLTPFGKIDEAKRMHRQFKFPGSDFLTQLNILREYFVNKMDERWVSDNYLNNATLSEATKVYRQLMDIVKSLGEEQTGGADPDDIAKAIIAGWADSLLVAEKKGKYKFIKGGEANISIHPQSVLAFDNPNLLVAADIVKTSSVVARLCQVVKPEWIPQVAPQLLIEEGKPGRYDSKTGQVLERISVNFKGRHKVELSFIERPAPPSLDATRMFAHEIAQGHIPLPPDLIRHNEAVMTFVRNMWIRSGGKIPKSFDPEVAFRPSRLVRVFAPRLGEINSRSALNTALELGQVDLRLHLENYLSQEDQAQILTDNPDTITVNDKQYDIHYSRKHKFSAEILLELGDVSSLPDTLTFPSGREVGIRVNIGGNELFGSIKEVKGRMLDSL